MADETLRFDIVGRDNASGAFSKVAGATKDMGDRMDVASRHAFALDEALKRQSAAARSSVDATLASAKADKILADAERVLRDGALEAEYALKKQGDAARKAGEDSAAAAGPEGLGALLGGGGIPGGGMGALIAAGAVVSPMLVTLGFGLGGFAAAAAGAAKPIEAAAQKTGGLAANMKSLDPEQRALAKSILGLGDQYSTFEKQLQPEVLHVFGKGIQLAGSLMHDVQPIAAATGKALGGVLSDIDAEFRSNNWQNFFHFMAQTAGPDIRLLGADFVSLSGDLPTLLEALQPVASALLKVVDYTGQAIRLAELASTNFSSLAKSGKASGDGFNATTEGAKAAIPGMEYMSRLAHEVGSGLDILYGNSGKAAKGTQDLAGKARDEAAAAKAQAAEIAKLNAQITTHIAKVLTLEGDEVTWKQAQQAATQAIGQNSHALDGNSKSALAARSSIIQATTQVIKFADDSDTSTSALHRASGALQDQIGWLERHAGKSKIARQEIALLIQEETKIKREIDQKVNIDGRGRWSVAGSGSPGGLGHRVGATGGRVPGFGGGDVHPYLLEGGEAIVPKHLTPAVAPFLAAQGVPGFAAGGIIPSYGGSVGGLSPWVQHNMTATDSSVTGSIAGALAHALQTELSGLGSVAPASGSALAAQNYARSLLSMYGWSQGQMSSLIPLWNQESGWSANAVNPSSGAYGIPQALPSVWGHPYALGDYKNQVIWGLNYIRSRYGSPGGAEAHELSAGWYDRGGYLPPGLSLAYNGTGKPEPVGGAGATYNIHITLPAGSDRESGRRIVEAIRKYEQGSGKSWRS